MVEIKVTLFYSWRRNKSVIVVTGRKCKDGRISIMLGLFHLNVVGKCARICCNKHHLLAQPVFFFWHIALLLLQQVLERDSWNRWETEIRGGVQIFSPATCMHLNGITLNGWMNVCRNECLVNFIFCRMRYIRICIPCDYYK